MYVSTVNHQFGGEFFLSSPSEGSQRQFAWRQWTSDKKGNLGHDSMQRNFYLDFCQIYLDKLAYQTS